MIKRTYPKKDFKKIPQHELRKVEAEFDIAFDYKRPFKERFKAFIRGENKAGRTVGMVLDGLSLVFPRLRTARNLARKVITRKQNPMLDKIKSLKNFINVRDVNGNFSWQEVLASLIQIGIATGVVYGLVYLGIYDKVAQLLGL